MKKLLLGCGIVLLLGLGTIGFITWQVWPELREAQQRTEVAQQRLAVLAEQYPFDAESQVGFDTERFATFLDMRTVLRTDVRELLDDFRRREDEAKDQELGMIDMLKLGFGHFPMVFEPVVSVLDANQMSLDELGYYVQVLWATLSNVDGGGGGGDDAQLNRLRGLFPNLKSAYADVAAEESPTIDELVAAIDLSIVNEARSILAIDVPRVQAGMMESNVEAILLLFSTSGFTFEFVPQVQAVHGTEDPGADR